MNDAAVLLESLAEAVRPVVRRPLARFIDEDYRLVISPELRLEAS